MRWLSRACFLSSVTAVFLCAGLARAAEQGQGAWDSVDSHRHFCAAFGAQYSEAAGRVDLTDGGLLVEPEGAYEVDAPLASVQPHRHALVLVRVTRGCEHVLVLLGHADLTVSGQRTQLRCGEDAMVTDHQPSDAELLGTDTIGRRRLRMATLPDGRCLAVAEFSLPQAIEREPILYRLIHSVDHHDRAVKERLIKMAAVLNMVTASHGQYITRSR